MIGHLRLRLCLQKPIFTDDGAGGKNREWRTIDYLWARKRDSYGEEGDFAGQRQAIVKSKITIRFRNDISSAMRFLDGDRIFQIKAILDESGRKVFLTCLCEEMADVS